MKELIPEVIDLVEVLAEIAASMKPHSSETERCKTSKPQIGKTKISPTATTAMPQSEPLRQQARRKLGKV
jgi:hypothetical protein